jgi:hypothetical protein
VVGRNVDADGIEAVPERIRSLIAGTPFDLGQGEVARLSCSIGFTTNPVVGATPHILTLEQVVTLADGALYIAKKKAGRNAWVGLLGSPATTAEGIHRALRADPDRIIQEGHFEIRSSRDLSAPAGDTRATG